MARQSKRTGAIIALSIVVHLILLSVIGFNAPKPRFLDLSGPSALSVWLTPRLDRTTQAPRQGRASPLPRSPSSTAKASAAPPLPPAQQAIKPTAPSPLPPTAAAPAQGAAANLTTGGDVGAGVRAALRGRLGCDMQKLTDLTAEERARCNQHMAETAKLGPAYVDPVPAEKRAYYDAVQAAYQASRDPSAPYYRDANGNIQQWGHPPAIGCTLKKRFRPGASLSDKIKATGMIGVPIGPLSCGLALPQGSMTPELGIPAP